MSRSKALIVTGTILSLLLLVMTLRIGYVSHKRQTIMDSTDRALFSVRVEVDKIDELLDTWETSSDKSVDQMPVLEESLEKLSVATDNAISVFQSNRSEAVSRWPQRYIIQAAALRTLLNDSTEVINRATVKNLDRVLEKLKDKTRELQRELEEDLKALPNPKSVA